jgi:fumarate reductase subunit C
MAALAHPDSMKPHGPERTRSAPPFAPAGYPLAQSRYRAYILFAATSIPFLLQGFLVLRGAWALGSGPEAWAAYLDGLANPIYRAWHALVLVVTIWFGARTFFKLFTKTQPPIFPLPPLELIPPAIGAAWLAVTLVLVAILGGLWP